MRIFVSLFLFLVLSVSPRTLSGGGLMWPDADISIPPEVRSYILSECREFKGFSEETVGECVRGESFGYRAVVMMLTDPVTREKAAERYRACRAGLGRYGGRFHRRKAECIGGTFHITWRFELTQRAGIEETVPLRQAENEGTAPDASDSATASGDFAVAENIPAH